MGFGALISNVSVTAFVGEIGSATTGLVHQNRLGGSIGGNQEYVCVRRVAVRESVESCRYLTHVSYQTAYLNL